MALNVDKNRQIAGYTETPSAATTKAASTSVSAIDFSTAAGSINGVYKIKQGDSLQAIAIQLLIASGNQNPTPEQITEIMQKIATANGCTSIDDFNTRFINNIGSELNLQGIIESEQPAEEQPTETEPETLNPSVAQSEMEELALKVAKEQNMENNVSFDDIIAMIKTKDTSELTQDELKLLEKYDNQVSNEASITDKNRMAQEKELADFFKELMNPEIAKLPPEEQTAERFKQYLIKNSPEYNALTEKQKEEYFNKNYAILMDMAQVELTEEEKAGIKGEFAEKLTSVRAAFLLEMAKKQGMPVADLQKMPREAREEILKNGENTAIEMAFKMINDRVGDKLKTATGKERVDIYADAILGVIDGNYAKMPEGSDKDKVRDDMIMKFAKEYLKNENIEQQLNDPRAKEALYTKVSFALQFVAEGDGTESTKNLSYRERIDLLSNPETKIDIYRNMMKKDIQVLEGKEGLSTDEKIRLAKLKKIDQILKIEDSIIGEDKNLTNSQVLERINEQLETCEDADKRKILHRMKSEVNARISIGGGEETYKRISLSHKDKATVENKEHQQYIEDQMSKIDAKTINTPEGQKILSEFLNNDKVTVDDIVMMQKVLEKKGISKEEFNNQLKGILTPEAFTATQAAIKKGDTEGMKTLIDICGDVDIINNPELADRVHGMVRHLPADSRFDTKEDQITIGSAVANHEALHDTYLNGLNEHISDKTLKADILSGISNSGEVSDASIAKFNYKFINDVVKSDEEKLFYGQTLSQNVNNAAALEGIAAASNSISDTNTRNQYNAAVTTAAQSYPPEQQKTINTAMQTGTISNETLSRTTPPATSSTSSSSSTSSASSNKYTTSTTTGTTSTSSTSSTSYTSTTSSNTNNASTKSYTSTSVTGTTTGSSTAQSSTFAGMVRGYTPTSSADAIRASVAASEAKRQAAMDNAYETAKSIEEAVEIWNNTHPKKLSVDDIDAVKAAAAIDVAREAIETSATSETEKEKILKALSNATSISEVYDILVGALGASRVQDKFIEILASSGSTTNIKAFVASRAGSGDSIVKQLFLRTSSTSLRKELLGMMSADTVAELLANKQITDLSSVDQRVLVNYVMKNLFLMSNNEFARFLNAIADPNEKNRLIEMRTGVSQLKNRKNTQTPTNPEPTPSVVESAGTSDASTVQPAPQAFSFAPSNTPIAPETLTTTPQEETTPAQPQATKLAKNEMSKDLGNGTILTREGAGFGAISNTDFDLTRVVKKPKEGAPIGMEDKTLTVNSVEWNKKYNNNNAPTTAFTMKALEEDDMFNFGGVWSGNKGNFKGKPIKKNGLRFNA